MSRFSLWWKQFGIKRIAQVQDERDREVQARAVRNGYVVAGATVLGFSALREILAGQSSLFWPTAAIVILPLLVPLAQRLASGGLTTDERVRRLQIRMYGWASLLCMGSLFVFGVYRDAVFGDIDAMRYFWVAMQTGLLVFITTQVGQNTIQAPSRGWMASAIVLLFILILVAFPILLSPFSEGTGIRPSAGSIVMSLLMGVILAIHVVVTVLAAGRRRREEREEQQDERQSTQAQ